MASNKTQTSDRRLAKLCIQHTLHMNAIFAWVVLGSKNQQRKNTFVESALRTASIRAIILFVLTRKSRALALTTINASSSLKTTIWCALTKWGFHIKNNTSVKSVIQIKVCVKGASCNARRTTQSGSSKNQVHFSPALLRLDLLMNEKFCKLRTSACWLVFINKRS